MNCRQARQLISSYIDYQLTGQQMLEMRQHLHDCPECAREHLALRQVKALVRALGEQSPHQALPERITAHLDAPYTSDSVLLVGAARPLRGRRLAGALALSCLSLLIMAVPFAPSTADVSGPAPLTPPAAFLMLASSPMQARPLTLSPPALTFTAGAGTSAARTQSAGGGQGGNLALPYAQRSMPGADAEPWDDEAVGGYVQGDATLADFNTH